MYTTRPPLILHPLTSRIALRLLLFMFVLVCLVTWLTPAAWPIQLATSLLAALLYLRERRELRRRGGIETLVLKPDGGWLLRYADGREQELPASAVRAELLPRFIRLSFDSRLQLALFPDSLAADGFRRLKVRLSASD